jgi:hypothetical protein
MPSDQRRRTDSRNDERPVGASAAALSTVIAREMSAAVRVAAGAWEWALMGDHAAARAQAAIAAGIPTVSRRERHAVAILVLAAQASQSRAAGLAAEHLAEFPGDALVSVVSVQLATRSARGTEGGRTDQTRDQCCATSSPQPHAREGRDTTKEAP